MENLWTKILVIILFFWLFRTSHGKVVFLFAYLKYNEIHNFIHFGYISSMIRCINFSAYCETTCLYVDLIKNNNSFFIFNNHNSLSLDGHRHIYTLYIDINDIILINIQSAYLWSNYHYPVVSLIHFNKFVCTWLNFDFYKMILHLLSTTNNPDMFIKDIFVSVWYFCCDCNPFVHISISKLIDHFHQYNLDIVTKTFNFQKLDEWGYHTEFLREEYFAIINCYHRSYRWSVHVN